MAALTADVDHPHKGNLDEYKLSIPCVAAGTFYKGAMCYGDAATGLIQVTPYGAGDVFLGICSKQVVTAIGDLVEIYTGGLWALPVTTPAEANVGDACFQNASGAPTDNFADAIFPVDEALAANDVLIGKMIALDTEETTRAWILLQPGWIYSATLGWV